MKRIKGVLLAALLTVTVSMPVYADRSEKVELPQSSTDYYMTVDSGEDGVDIYPSTDKKSGKFNGTEIKDGTVLHIEGETEKDGENWGYTEYQGRHGYVPLDELRPSKDEELAAVSFYATDVDTTYQVYVVPEFEDADSLNDRKLVAEGSFEQAGYYTVRLDEAVKLKDNQKFAVVVHIQTPGAVHPVAIEYDADSRTREFDITDGEGYISLYGNKWMSAEKNKDCNLCLKAFTNDRSKK